MKVGHRLQDGTQVYLPKVTVPLFNIGIQHRQDHKTCGFCSVTVPPLLYCVWGKTCRNMWCAALVWTVFFGKPQHACKTDTMVIKAIKVSVFDEKNLTALLSFILPPFIWVTQEPIVAGMEVARKGQAHLLRSWSSATCRSLSDGSR